MKKLVENIRALERIAGLKPQLPNDPGRLTPAQVGEVLCKTAEVLRQKGLDRNKSVKRIMKEAFNSLGKAGENDYWEKKDALDHYNLISDRWECPKGEILPAGELPKKKFRFRP